MALFAAHRHCPHIFFGLFINGSIDLLPTFESALFQNTVGEGD